MIKTDIPLVTRIANSNLHYLRMLNKNLSFPSQLVFEMIFKDFSLHLPLCKLDLPPILANPTPCGDDLTKHNIHHLRMLPHKFKPFYPFGFCRKRLFFIYPY